ncbi:MAG: glutamine-hydrolyzing GMP synthase, partial [Anaerolineales bacterium]
MDTLVILDFGSQYSQLIARRLREANVYCELFAHDVPAETVRASNPRAFVLSGGPSSVVDPGAPRLPAYVLESHLPVLGICYGMQLMAQALGGIVRTSTRREYGRMTIQRQGASRLLPQSLPETFEVWMSHGDQVEKLPAGFQVVASSSSCPIAAMENPGERLYALQFHPEVAHTQHGLEILGAFLEAAGLERTWTPAWITQQSVERIRSQIGAEPVLAGVSGGVDSTVAAALVHRAVGDQLKCIFVDNGLLRLGEGDQVMSALRQTLRAEVRAVNARAEFLEALAG